MDFNKQKQINKLMKTHNKNPESIDQLTNFNNIISFIIKWIGKDGEHNSFAQVIAMMADYGSQVKTSHDHSIDKLLGATNIITEEKNRLHKLVCEYKEQLKNEWRKAQEEEPGK